MSFLVSFRDSAEALDKKVSQGLLEWPEIGSFETLASQADLLSSEELSVVIGSIGSLRARALAILAIGRSANESARTLLIRLLNDSHFIVSYAAAYALVISQFDAQLGNDDRACQWSNRLNHLAALQHGETLNFDEVVQDTVRNQDASTLKALLRRLESPHEMDRIIILVALRNSNAEAVVAEAMTQLAQQDDSATVRRQALRFLAGNSDERVVELMRFVVKNDAAPENRSLAVKALGATGQQEQLAFVQKALPSLIGEGERLAAIRVLGACRFPALAETAVTYALDDTKEVILRVAAMNSMLKSSHAYDTYVKVLSNSSVREARMNAAWNLERLGERKAVPVLKKALQDETDDATRSIISDALKALERK